MVAVTGATGHLGTVLVKLLVENGEQVRYITRGAPAQGLDDLDAEPVRAELFDVDILADAFSGASVVYHAAGRISILAGDRAELHRVNVEGTRAVLQAARRAGVGRFVHVGTIEAFPLEGDIRPITESLGIDPDHTVMEYGRSKAIGMLDALAEAGRGMDCVVCCPTGFIGPPDYRRSAIGQMVLDYLCGRLPAYVSGGFDFVDVRDVAQGLIRAAQVGADGRTYLLSGHYATVPQIMDMLESVSGVKKPRICLPTGLVLPFMPIVETFYRLTGLSPRFTRNSLRILSLGAEVDSARARVELGYTSRPLEETLADTVQWFVDTGRVASPRE